MGQIDGYTVLLQPEVGHGDAMDGVIERETEIHAESASGGLSRFMCFEFVDS